MKKHILLPSVVLLAGILIAAVLVLLKRPVEPEPIEFQPPLVRVMPVEHQDLQLRVRTQGAASPRSEITLVSEVSGRITWIAPALADGGFFEEDELLVKIDPRDFELAVIRARAEVRAAEVRLAREEAEAEAARQEWLELGGDERPAGLALREPQVAEAKALLASAEASLEQAERDLARSELRAPFAGRVAEKQAGPGQFVNRGAPLARLYATDYAEVRLPLPIEQLAFLDLPLTPTGNSSVLNGPEAILHGRFAGRNQVWTGQVVRTESVIDPRTRMLHAVVQVPDPLGRKSGEPRFLLPIGLFLEAEILGRTVRDVAVIPRTALIDRNRVLMVDAEDRLRFRTVEVLRLDREQAVIQSGLEPGERVCLSPIHAPVEGMRVQTIHEPAPQDGSDAPGPALSEGKTS